MNTEEFFMGLDRLVSEKYAIYYDRMGLMTGWNYENDVSKKGDKGTFSLIYSPDKDDWSDFEPLVEYCFFFPDEADVRAEVYARMVFEQMDKTLKEYLKDTYKKWTRVMADYYTCLNNQATDCFERGFRIPPSPMENPEGHFLTHRMVVLSINA